MSDKHYNVWYISEYRWTNHKGQNTKDPRQISLEEAKKWLNELTDSGRYHTNQFKVMMIGPNKEPLPIEGFETEAEEIKDNVEPTTPETVAEPPAFDFETYNTVPPGRLHAFNLTVGKR